MINKTALSLCIHLLQREKIMIRFSIIVCLFTIFNESLFAQQGKIHGIVLDRSSHKPLEYASVSIFRVADSVYQMVL